MRKEHHGVLLHCLMKAEIGRAEFRLGVQHDSVLEALRRAMHNFVVRVHVMEGVEFLTDLVMKERVGVTPESVLLHCNREVLSVLRDRWSDR